MREVTVIPTTARGGASNADGAAASASRRAALAGVALAVLAGTGCFDPSLNGIACGEDQACPPGLSCDPGTNRCVDEPGAVDASMADASPPDASVVDAPLGPDAAEPDASEADAETADADTDDASVADADMADAEMPDASLPDAVPAPDALPPDAPPSTNADLAALVLSAPDDLLPAFNPVVTSYAMNVSILVQEVTVTPAAADPDATITVNGTAVDSGATSAPIALDLGLTNVTVLVTAPASNTKGYSVLINRGGLPTQSAYIKASNAEAGDGFGGATLSGDTLVVVSSGEDSSATGVDGDQADNSAPESGAAYVFRRTGTTWVQEAYLKASNTDAGDGFGGTLSLDGDTLAVAAFYEDSNATGVNGEQTDNSAPESGAVYVFRRTGNVWAQEAYIKASNAEASDRFGSWGLALDGDTLAVGASYEDSAATGVNGDEQDNSATDSGAVYVFRRTGTTWEQEAYLKASNAEPWDIFGGAVALRGDTLAVTAGSEDSSATGVDGDEADNSALESGAVYVFRRLDGVWTQEAYLKASNAEANDRFGLRLALWGDTLAVGAKYEDSSAVDVGGDQADNSAEDSGAAYVFRRSGGTWSQEAYFKASNTDAGDDFGRFADVYGELLSLSADMEDSAATDINGDQTDNSATDAGANYLFRWSGGTWTQQAYIKASNAEAGDGFSSGHLSHDTLVIGASGDDSAATGINGDQADNSAENSGAVYVFH